MDDAPQLRIEAVVPASGVRAWFDRAGRVVVHATDDGAHGKPWAALFLPLPDAGDGVPLDADTLLAHALWRALPGQDGSYVFTLDRADWPRAGRQVLLLLVCLCATGPHALPPPACDPQRPGRPPRAYEPAVAAAVATLLRGAGRDALRAGLIDQGDQGDQDEPADDRPDAVSFALGSCIYPCDILDHMPDDDAALAGPADASLLALGALIDRSAGDAPSLLLLAGDQVYVDATAGLFDPKVRNDKFRIAYERLFASRGAKAVLQRLGLDVEMTLDDHEISDNWEPSELALGPPGETSNFELGLRAYWKFQRGLDVPADLRRPLWRVRRHRGLRFFLGDTRTEREARSAADFRCRRIMKECQREALFKWLGDPAPDGQPRFVVTPSLLLPRHLSVANDPLSALHSDAWEGYPASLHELLKFICDRRVANLVFLSGDEHLGCEALVSVSHAASGAAASFLSIHTPALYAPYPFANSRPQDFAARESFEFECDGSGPYRCTVSAHFAPPGDGVTLIRARRSGAGWQLDVGHLRPD